MTLVGPGVRHVFIRDLVIAARIGVYAAEQGAAQRIRLNLDLAVPDEGEADRAAGDEDLGGVVDYATIAAAARAVAEGGHTRLAETLAERIARACLHADLRIRLVRVRLEKLDIMPDAASVGVEIERRADG